ncbi:hypothetical protein [Amycolatopsis sp. NPDC059657]|uniref:hypothetical protein n=1 Tax=Amycolatopsis sp. NPDC059657 TaxID=3346899 RepID=UPI0036704DF2
MTDSGNHTYVDPQSVRSSADHIGGLMDDMQPFYTLGQSDTQAGNFETATWLQQLVRDRQTGVLQHAIDVKLVCRDIQDSLHQITTTFEETDQHNSENLERDLYHDVNLLKIDAYNSGENAKGFAKPGPGTEASPRYDSVPLIPGM